MTISFRRYVGSSGVLKKLYGEFTRREATTGTAIARRYATWEFNNKPQLRESLQEYIDNKPEEAACMVESKDDEGYYDSWIKDVKRIENSMTHRDHDWIFDMPVPDKNWQEVKDAEYAWFNTELGIKETLDPYDIPIKRPGRKGVTYVLTGDPGLGNVAANGDAFGLCLAHPITVIDANGKAWLKPVIDFSFRFTGRMFEQGEVQLVAITNLIAKLINHGYDIQIFSFDGWNSASITQWITRNYPDRIVYSKNIVDTKDYTALRDAIFSEVPPTEAVGNDIRKISEGAGIKWFWHPVLFWELSELRVDKFKGKVDHTEESKKDMADAVAKAVRIITLAWPFRELNVSGTNTARPVTRESIRAMERHVAEQDKKLASEAYQRNLNSQVAGLGAFKKKGY